MPQLFGSAGVAAIANSALWYYLLGKFPPALLFSHGIKFLISYVLAFFVMAWLWHSREMAQYNDEPFLDSIINGLKLPFLHVLLMSIVVVGIYVIFEMWSKNWVYNVKLCGIVGAIAGVLYFMAYAALSDVYQNDLEEDYTLPKFLCLAVYSFAVSLFLTLPFMILKAVFYDFPRATYRRKFELLLLIGIIGGAVFAVDYLMMKGKLWKTSIEYAESLDDIFEDDTKGRKKK